MAKVDNDNVRERLAHAWWDTITADDGPRAHAFGPKNIGNREKSNLQIAAQLSHYNIAVVTAMLFGAPTETIRSWRECVWSLNVACRTQVEKPMWYHVDGVKSRKDVEPFVMFTERSSLDWTFFHFKLETPITISARQSIDVVVEFFGKPVGELKVVMDGFLERDMY